MADSLLFIWNAAFIISLMVYLFQDKEQVLKIWQTRDALHFYIFVFGLSFILLWPAYLNGYPFVFTDTHEYITGQDAGYRSMGYILFIKYSSLGKSLWFTVFSQALITAFLLVRIPWLLLGDSRFKKLGVGIVIASVLFFSDIARYPSWVMPDISSSWLFMGGVLFFISEKKLDKVAAILGIAGALGCHNANVLTAILCTFVLCFVAFLNRGKQVVFWRTSLVFLWVEILLLFSVSLFNYSDRYNFQLFPTQKANFIFSKLTSYGLLSEAMDKYCGKNGENFVCIHKEVLKKADGQDASRLMWLPDSPFSKYQIYRYQSEITDLVWIMLRNNPGMVMKRSLWDTLRLLACFDREDDMAKWRAVTDDYVIRTKYPSDFIGFLESRQRLGFPVRLTMISWMDQFCGGIVFALLGLLVMGCRQWLDERMRFICLALLLFIFLHAFIDASLSGVFARYNMRVLWLVQFIFMIAVVVFINSRRNYFKASADKH